MLVLSIFKNIKGGLLPTAIFIASLGILSLNAYAGIQEDIQSLVDQRDYAAALKMIDSGLESEAHKQDQNLMLLKGYALVQLQRFDEAVEYYQKLKTTIPNHAEPGNNLAIIYRIQNKYDLAIQELNRVIKTHPKYARAYENLGDTYVELARIQYQKGQAETGSATLQSKAILSQNFHTTAMREMANLPQAAKTTVEDPANVAASADAKVSPKEEVINRLTIWVNDWMSQDADRYLSNYSKSFKPSNGLSLDRWVQRKKRILANAGFIKVGLTSVVINFDSPNKATATFKQVYTSKQLESTSNKTVKLEKIGGDWLFISEASIDV